MTKVFREFYRARRELVGAFFVLTVGFVGPLLSLALKSSVDRYLVERSRVIFSADLAISGFRPLKQEEEMALRQTLAPRTLAREVEFVTMVSSSSSSSSAANHSSMLVQIKAVDQTYPIFGGFKFSDPVNENDVPVTATRLQVGNIAWAQPEVFSGLGLNVGDVIVVGKSQFRLAGKLNSAPGSARFAGFAPNIFVSYDAVEATGLAQFGSQISYRTYLELPENTDPQIAANLAKLSLPDPDLFLRTPDDAMTGFERGFSFLKKYLLCVSLVIFALAWIAAFYILQLYFQARLKNSAIYLTFGASLRRTYLGGLLQVLTLLAVAFLSAVLVTSMLIRLVVVFFTTQLPEGFTLILPIFQVLQLGTMTVFAAVAFTFPQFQRLKQSRLSAILNESLDSVSDSLNKQSMFIYLPLIATMLLLAAWLVGSWFFAVQVTGGIFVVAVLGWLLSRLIFRSLAHWLRGSGGTVRLIALQLARSRPGVNLCFLTFLISALVLNLVPHLLRSAQQELAPLNSSARPALFLFNVPESQLEDLQKFAAREGAELRYPSPLILARLLRVNGTEAKQDQFQRFPVRLSIRSETIASERIVDGREAVSQTAGENTFQNPAEITMEQAFAERNEFKLDDVIEFDVQGVAVFARVVGIRKVNWTSFNPNFFIVFPPGILDDAPKTLVANFNFLQPEKAAENAKVQYALVRNFPDVSVIDVGQTLSRVAELIQSILKPVQYSAYVAVLMALLILIGVVIHNLRMRKLEFEILKILGSYTQKISALVVGEYFSLALVAGLLGAALAVVLGAFFVRRVFDIAPAWDFAAVLASVFSIVLLASTSAFLASRRVLSDGQASRKM